MGVHCLSRAVQLSAEDLDYGLSLADCLFDAGYPERSNAEYERLSALYPEDSELWCSWATMLHESHDLKAAMDIINIALQQLPDDFRLWYFSAAVHYLGGRNSAAMEALQYALALNYREHEEMFKFAPELRQVGTINEMIARYAH
jgi:tetratricopeptide (TPR) repeat protein